MGSSRVGSSPTRSVKALHSLLQEKAEENQRKKSNRSLIDAEVKGWAAMAEWLRRLTRNQMGSSRVGSNPTCSELIMGFGKTTPV